MGNYEKIEYDFIERTMKLISQYEITSKTYAFEEQYNYTLLLNCMLGVIILPKERVFSHIPNPKLTKELKKNMGLNESVISDRYSKLRELIIDLRNSIAHCNFDIKSETDDFL